MCYLTAFWEVEARNLDLKNLITCIAITGGVDELKRYVRQAIILGCLLCEHRVNGPL